MQTLITKRLEHYYTFHSEFSVVSLKPLQRNTVLKMNTKISYDCKRRCLQITLKSSMK
ncbi:MAG: hypothetical protein K0S45_2457 [Nitrospira sp.]|nr:hypothetical protein [Nitrospira sp.]